MKPNYYQKKNIMNQISIIGLGNQAKSWAQNLLDSGFTVELSVRNITEEALIFQNNNPNLNLSKLTHQWVEKQTHIALLIPDDQHEVFLNQYSQNFIDGTCIIYAHGFSEVAYGLSKKFSKLNHLLLAPKSIASELRNNYIHKKNLSAVYSIITANSKSDDTHKRYLLNLARNLGITWGPFPVSFEQECKADLFSEQTLLCNFLPELLGQTFQKLTDKNIPWELAFCEIFLELKLIVNALESVGPKEFYNLISPNALIGSQEYVEKWHSRLNFNDALDECWNELESGNIINRLLNTDYKSTKDKILKKWDNHVLTKAFNNYKSSKKFSRE